MGRRSWKSNIANSILENQLIESVWIFGILSAPIIFSPIVSLIIFFIWNSEIKLTKNRQSKHTQLTQISWKWSPSKYCSTLEILFVHYIYDFENFFLIVFLSFLHAHSILPKPKNPKLYRDVLFWFYTLFFYNAMFNKKITQSYALTLIRIKSYTLLEICFLIFLISIKASKRHNIGHR